MNAKRLNAVLAAAVLGLASVAQASIATPSYSTVVSNARMAYVTVSIAESTCTSACSGSFTKTLPTGLSSSAAAIWMNSYYMNFADAAGAPIAHAQLMLSKTSYNATTGVFTWSVNADLTGNSPPTDTTFKFGATLTILVGDNTNVRATQRSVGPTSFTGAGASGECDSTAVCTDSTTQTNAGVTGAIFRQMLLRGFEVGTQSGNGLSLRDIKFDATGYSASGTSAVGSTTCTWVATTTEDLDCTVGLSTLAFATTNLTNQFFTDSVRGVTGSNYPGITVNSSSGTAASSFLLGLEKTHLTPSAALTPFKAMANGCNGFLFSSSPGTGSATGQSAYTLSKAGGTATYDGDVQCYGGFLY